MKDFEKGNILIAEFMGADGAPKYNPESWDIYITGHLDVDSDHEEAQHFYTPSEMKYHKSWDWLMPVIGELDFQELEPMENIKNALSRRYLPDVYKAVVELIKLVSYQQ